jgi:phospholipid/cholesterol/gamma-HCH transport system permease protein
VVDIILILTGGQGMISTPAAIELSQDGRTLHCVGAWTLSGVKALPTGFTKLIRACGESLQINTGKITDLDTLGALRLSQLYNAAENSGKKTTLIELSPKHRQIFELVHSSLTETPDQDMTPPPTKNPLVLLGEWSEIKWINCLRFCTFVGEVVLQFGKIRWHGLENLWLAGLKIIQTAGSQALPIVAMMSFLVGIVLSYQLGVQLKVYGADIYVVEASGIAILREFSPLMTSIIIAGRTSTAFAALIGTMKVNDELDALSTMGISVIERIVLPRVLGLIVVLPLLVIWSSLFSILGSMIMVKGQLNIGYGAFLQRFVEEVSVKQYTLGLVKTPVFALIISMVGCFQGFQAGITADSVGLKTTAAAVQAIFLIIVADAFFSLLFSWRGL